jgi:transposase
MPPVCRSGFVDPAQWRPVALASGKPGELEHGLQTLCAVVRAWGMGRYASTFCQRSRYGTNLTRQHHCTGTPLRRGSFKKNGGQASQALGRSRGGFSTKIHANVDALGNPLRFLLTGGQRHDITQANGLIADFDFERVIADRSYDSDEFLDRIAAKQAEAVIPPRKNRTEPRDYDHHLYKERHLIECFFNKIKHYRRLFSRFEKLDQRLLGFLSFAGALIWLR